MPRQGRIRFVGKRKNAFEEKKRRKEVASWVWQVRNGWKDVVVPFVGRKRRRKSKAAGEADAKQRQHEN